MGKSGKISQYRERLDKTLALPELTNLDSLKTLVRNQLRRSSVNEDEACSENVIQKRTDEVSYILDMLRSASVSENEASKTAETSHGAWKLKDDNEEYRVMYRPGPQGTPFHTLLVEGYVDGPVDICLCISWESTLYKKWWPQISFPPFKITLCECLQKVRIGEQISLVRVKVTWPLSAREAVVHFFLFEYLQDDLIVVLVNTITDLNSIDRNTHGFTKDGIPEAKEVVRIDVVGGFAIQKVTSERSYFRTIANMDMKLDFVPPSLINFVSRQLIGNGFRLYQKAVASVSNYDEDYSKVLKEPMYTQIQETLYSIDKPNVNVEGKNLESISCVLPEEHSIEDLKKNFRDMEQNVHQDKNASESLTESAQVMDKNFFGEIEEEKTEESTDLEDEIKGMEQKYYSNNHVSGSLHSSPLATDRKAFSEIEEESEDIRHVEKCSKDRGQLSTSKIVQKSVGSHNRHILLSPEVEQALETLENAISVVREYRSNILSGLSNEATSNQEKSAENDSSFLEDGGGGCSNAEVSVEVPENGKIVERTCNEFSNNTSNRDIRCTGSSSYSKEVNHNRIAPVSSEQHLAGPNESNQVVLSKNGTNGMAEVPVKDSTLQDNQQMSAEGNGICQNGLHEEKKLRQQKKYRVCCFGPSLGQI